MSLRQNLYSNIFFRNMFMSFGVRKGNPREDGEINPYFLFRIGPYQNDFFLYFPQKPYPLRYKNEIFNKLGEFSGYDIVRYLDFHLSAYPDREDFLEFFYYEVSERLHQTPRNMGLLSAMNWVERNKVELSKKKNYAIGLQTCDESPETDSDNHSKINENLNKSLVDFQIKLGQGISEILLEAERSMRGLTSSFSTGSIELNNRLHEDRLIQLLILIQQIKAPGRAEQLFKKMNATDIAAILQLHFRAFHDNKLNTVQRKISEQTDLIRPSQAKVKRLTEALEDFFY